MGRKEMDQKYRERDPFKVRTDPADAVRKDQIIETLDNWVKDKRNGEQFELALDIGCGEGWMTVDIPAKEIVGFDLSKVALTRFPQASDDKKVTVTSDPMDLRGLKFDCIVAAGVLVRDYDFQSIINLINLHASGLVLTCQTDVTEVHEVGTIQGKPISTVEFPYRSYKQRLRLFTFSDVDPVEETEAAMQAGVIPDPASNETEPVDTTDEPDRTFTEIVDEAIDALPEGHDFDHLILSEDMRFQLMGDETSDNYRGFKLEINEEASRGGYEFYHRPESVDEPTEDEDSHGEHPDRDGDDPGGDDSDTENTKSSL